MTQKTLAGFFREAANDSINGPELSREAKARDRGMELAADHGAAQLARCRRIAFAIGVRDGECSIVEVRDEAAAQGLEITWGNWAGSIFKEPHWRPAGFKHARHKGSHARVVRVWRLR